MTRRRSRRRPCCSQATRARVSPRPDGIPSAAALRFGACLPCDDQLLHSLIECIAVLVLMPAFFALAGLSTTSEAFVQRGRSALLLVPVAAIIGKIAGAAAGARIAGYLWRASRAVGSP